jgi:hypothetical protein
MNRDEEYNRLHDHCQALGRERDGYSASQTNGVG